MLQTTYSHSHELPAEVAHQQGEQIRILETISNPEVNLSLWQRPEEHRVALEAATLATHPLRDARRPTSLTSFDEDVCALLQLQGVNPANYEALRADMFMLTQLFAPLTEGRPFRFRLLTTAKDDCRRFHLDRINLRLLCTYHGPGTEWLRNEQVDRLAQARGAPNEDIIRFGEASRFQPFWVGIMRGDPANNGDGLVHRSPPIAGTGQARVLFCLDC
ncbi:hypothetical protein BST95_10550 [Halioglobus japonicus]|uniref:DUF1826 domain-containing protein n=1 Tax=Halioglobus japonicus TaxID=930805 RepID=A0AAP8MF02_9GAMM|nr:DUF1826 domain-containing protein [Halioglobus japonicus]AQA18610.1 hypothetical protein BST95_10550 [Halioglobus japonicus]PLW86635.1 DUF1826 domain-containing protein [Halioglobus japonicus]GHD11841.1 hypothetical protein GCM10007052_12030 [Halioglobus japonicus]